MNTYSNNKKIIDIAIQAASVTPQLLKSALQNIISNQHKIKSGQLSLEQLSHKAHGKLESIEITENNIRDFKDTAIKYNIDYSLKRDKGANPPIYHVFFATNDTENFKRAFMEYAVGVKAKQSNKDNQLTVSKEQIQKLAVKVNEKTSKHKEKVREKSKQVAR